MKNSRLPQKSSRKFTYIYRKVYTAYSKNIVVLILTLVSGALYSQQPVFQPGPKQIGLKKNTAAMPAFNALTASSVTNFSTASFRPFSIYANPATPAVAGIQKDLYIKGFGFFCKKEMQFEKSVKLPLRFRLGSLEQCNILEQKY